MPKQTSNLTGKRYERLLVIRFAGFIQAGSHPRREAFWECQCDCGNTVRVRGNNLKRGGVKSCGCYGDELRASLGRRFALPSGRSSANSLYARYQYSAKKRGHDFVLSHEEALHLFSSPCYYCGVGPSQAIHRHQNNGDFPYNGIDRLDNARGYCAENCVPCCGRCNRAKHKDDVEGFKEWVKRVYEHLYSA